MNQRNEHSQGVNPGLLTRSPAGVRWLLWSCFTLLLLCLPFALRAEAVADVRVLIDVSGSMKQNDPQNLRAPALRMLVGLMPEGSRSGVWTFGQYTNMQVKLDKVDKAWKDKAMAEAGKIHSRGLFTNIEEAVDKATTGWTQPDPAYTRHVILLTDGMVDVSKDSKVNEASRRRLLQEVLPRLEAADVAIHTIALSRQADSELLSALSGATKGAFVQADSADELQRVFLKLFEKSVAPDALPIQDNKFSVDKHVNDFTLLIFLAKDSPATVVHTPDGQKWSQSAHAANVSWHHEAGYDLISVKEPKAGEWSLQARLDPDNRVMIVTNLRLKVDKLPNTIMLGDEFDVRARLLEDGKTVDNANLLSKTAFTIAQHKAEAQLHNATLKDDGQAPDVLKGDGVYSAVIKSLDQAGAFEFVIAANSQTFKREMHHTLQVHDSPANFQITQAAPGKPFKISIQPHAGLIRPESVSMQVKLPDGEPQILKQVGDLEWEIEAPEKFANQHFGITLVGKRYNDQELKMDFEQVLTVTDKPQSLSLHAKATEHKAEEPRSEAEPASAPAPEEKQDEPKEEAVAESGEKKGFNWTLVISLVVVVNLVVILGGWFGYRFWKKRQARQIQEVEAGVKA